MPSLAVLDEEHGATALMTDPVNHRIPIPSVRLTSRQSCNPSAVKTLCLNCGGSTTHHETTDPSDQPAPPCDDGDYPLDNPHPGQSPMASCQRCSGTDIGLSQTISGVTLPSPFTDTEDPRGCPDLLSVTEVHPRGAPLPGKKPLTLSQRFAGAGGWFPEPPSGGTYTLPRPCGLSGPMAEDERGSASVGQPQQGPLTQRLGCPDHLGIPQQVVAL